MSECKNCLDISGQFYDLLKKHSIFDIRSLREKNERLRNKVKQLEENKITKQNIIMKQHIDNLSAMIRQLTSQLRDDENSFQVAMAGTEIEKFYQSDDYEELFKDVLIAPALVELGSSGVTPPPAFNSKLKVLEL